MLEFPHTVSQAIISSTSQTLLDIADLSQCRPEQRTNREKEHPENYPVEKSNQSQATASTIHCTLRCEQRHYLYTHHVLQCKLGCYSIVLALQLHTSYTYLFIV